MHVWIEIDNPSHIHFYKVLITELKNQDHIVTVTAPDKREVKDTIKEHNIQAKIIGEIPYFFGLFDTYFHVWRAAKLAVYLAPRKIDIAFLTESQSMFHACLNIKVPFALLIETLDKKPKIDYMISEKCLFLISDNIPDQNILEAGININKTAKHYGLVNKNDINQNLKSISDIVKNLEFFRKRMFSSANA